MSTDESLNRFIRYNAKKTARVYRSSQADEDDYIQAGHLKLAQIRKARSDEHNFRSYAITAISRAMRCEALETMCGISAPHRVKIIMHRIEMLSSYGKTEKEICDKLKITAEKLLDLKLLIGSSSWDELFTQPVCNPDSFSHIDDLLSSGNLEEQDRVFILEEFINSDVDFNLTRKQKWSRSKSLRPKLVRSGYGI